MKHAIIILGHNIKRFFYIQEIIDQFHDDDDFDFFINFDPGVKPHDINKLKKHKLYKKIINNRHVKCLYSCHLIWGAYNIVDTEIKLLRRVTEEGNYGWVHLISGDSRFLYEYNMEYFKKWFREHDGGVCIELNNAVNTWRLRRFNPADGFIYMGSQWWSMSRKVLDICMNELDDTVSIFFKYFRQNEYIPLYNVPDELFFQYIVSRHINELNIYPKTMLVDWHSMSDIDICHPCILDMEFARDYVDSNLILSRDMIPFARKYNDVNEDSVEIFEYIKNNLMERH